MNSKDEIRVHVTGTGMTGALLAPVVTLEVNEKSTLSPYLQLSSAHFHVSPPLVIGVDTDHLAVLVTAYEALSAEVQDLKKEVAQLQADRDPTTVSLRNISDAAAKQEIKAYFEAHHGETIFSSDLVVALRLEYETVERLLHELQSEGLIAKA